MVLLYIPLHESILWCIIHTPYYSILWLHYASQYHITLPPIQSKVYRLAGLVLPGRYTDSCPCYSKQPLSVYRLSTLIKLGGFHTHTCTHTWILVGKKNEFTRSRRGRTEGDGCIDMTNVHYKNGWNFQRIISWFIFKMQTLTLTSAS